MKRTMKHGVCRYCDTRLKSRCEAKSVVDMQKEDGWADPKTPAHYARAELAERGAVAKISVAPSHCESQNCVQRVKKEYHRHCQDLAFPYFDFLQIHQSPKSSWLDSKHGRKSI